MLNDMGGCLPWRQVPARCARQGGIGLLHSGGHNQGEGDRAASRFERLTFPKLPALRGRLS